MSDRTRAEQAGSQWADRKADALEGMPAQDWPEEWNRAWAGDLHLAPEDRSGHARFEELQEFAQAAAAMRWSQLVEDRRDEEDVRAEPPPPGSI